ncbi:ATP-binding protein [Streptomyces sp. NBC_01198]|jgi:anti-sigma regulatory factor (Ser/Thr protein kinase)|uniref:ATP-binding protein n=1 Tax=Streptomyces sp. NBC_01198 TaxID=2903769 RepID=UPI002E10940E|nr:ATP-binding protein [Streptomyces sp. NBC_01198]
MWFTPIPKAVRTARHQVSRALTAWGVPEDAVETAVLVTSELLTNAIRHCHYDDPAHLVLVRITDEGTELRLEVSDPSRVRPRPGTATSDAESGRGLMLVRAAAAGFGARDREPDGKTVWATVGKSRR